MARILVVEDEPDLRMLLTLSLELDGHEVDAVVTGEEGLAHLRASRPDFVLLDLRLPGIDGLEVARRLPADHPPVVLMSAHGDSLRTRREALEAGCVDYLPKPFMPEDVERLLEEHVVTGAT